MCSGGAMSPGDELDIAQFSIAEIATAVEEARAANRYVMAHAYSGAAIKNAVTAGVRSIEHGNLMDEEAADAMKKAGAYLVPTMITYESIWRHGKDLGIPPFQMQKIGAARETAVASLELAKRKGLKIGLGSDLLGVMFKYQPHELELQGQVQTPMEVLLSATRINAEILRMEKQIGTVEPGKLADLIVVRGDPLKSLAVFQDAEKVALIMKDGKIYKNIL
jgi:imidazolonepropionase-like amidohydrolase